MEHLLELCKVGLAYGCLLVGKLIDGTRCIEKVRDYLSGVHVIVHCIVALGTQVLDIDGCLTRCSKATESLVCLKQALHTLLGSLQCLVAEVDSAAVVGLENEETDGHR